MLPLVVEIDRHLESDAFVGMRDPQTLRWSLPAKVSLESMFVVALQAAIHDQARELHELMEVAAYHGVEIKIERGIAARLLVRAPGDRSQRAYKPVSTSELVA